MMFNIRYIYKYTCSKLGKSTVSLDSDLWCTYHSAHFQNWLKGGKNIGRLLEKVNYIYYSPCVHLAVHNYVGMQIKFNYFLFHLGHPVYIRPNKKQLFTSLWLVTTTEGSSTPIKIWIAYVYGKSVYICLFFHVFTRYNRDIRGTIFNVRQYFSHVIKRFLCQVPSIFFCAISESIMWCDSLLRFLVLYN